MRQVRRTERLRERVGRGGVRRVRRGAALRRRRVRRHAGRVRRGRLLRACAAARRLPVLYPHHTHTRSSLVENCSFLTLCTLGYLLCQPRIEKELRPHVLSIFFCLEYVI